MLQLDRITMNPQVMGGKPCIRGMRVTAGTIVGLIAAGRGSSSRSPVGAEAPPTETYFFAISSSFVALMSWPSRPASLKCSTL